MKKKVLTGIVALLACLGVGLFLLWLNFKGIGPAFRGPVEDIAQKLPSVNDPNWQQVLSSPDFPLKLPKDFAIFIYAKDLPGARVMEVDGKGNMWVSQTGQGTVSMVNSQTGEVSEVFKDLKNPHGLAVTSDGQTLYIAEENKISKVKLYTDNVLEKVVDLPEGGRHVSRTISFGPDGRLYIAIGSTCNVCYEEDEKLGAIYSMNADGSDFKKVAYGLRNSVFFDWSYVDGKMWATEMGRDMLGDDLPPDEINIIEPGKDYGWPVCYGKNIHDTEFDKNQYLQDPCNSKVPSYIDLPAHSAPLGLAFIPEEGWPEEYWYNLIVAFHGSWNKTEPTGYKLVRIKLNAKGNYQGMEDLISGWLVEGGQRSLGRPVDILAQPGGVMYISDDSAGVIYKIQYLGNK